MMGKVKELQARLKEAQDNLVNVTATGESGGGMVKATVNGKKQVINIDIDPSLLQLDPGGAQAEQLGLSTKTVRNNVSNIFTKIQVVDRAQAIVKAREAGIGGR